MSISSRFVAASLAIAASVIAAASIPTLECGHSSSLRALFGKGLPPNFGELENPGDTDVIKYALDIEAIPSSSSVSGSVTVTARSLIDGLIQFHFRLADTMTVSSITLDGRSVAFTREDSITCRANFDRAYSNGEQFSLKINYSGATAGSGFGSIVWGTHGTPAVPYVFTLSEPYYCYTWWPAKEDNSDKTTADIWITVPNTISVVSNGLLTGTEAVAGSKTKYKWSTSYQIAPYLICFGATNFTNWNQTYNYTGGSMPVKFYVWPEYDTSAHRTTWEKCIQMLATYQPMFGLYPFVNEKYGMYQFTFSGGMEHQTITGEGSGSSSFSENVVAHELAHQWWGDMVTCKTWSDISINEGFATYCEALWLEKQPGSSGQAALTAAMSSRKPSAHDQSVYRTNTSDVNSIFSSTYTYRRGGWLLHQLRHIVGDTVFFNILTNFRSQYQFNSATWDDFAAVASSTYGQDLSWYFQKWVYGIGAVAYSYGYQNATVNGKRYLLLSMNQTQTSGYGTFIFPVDVRLTIGSAQTKLVWNDALAESYVIPVSGNVTAVSVDPDGWILTTAKTALAYVVGPPKIVETLPSPGARAARGLTQVKVTFHTPVSASAANFSLTGARTGARSFSYTYDTANNTAVMTFTTSLPDDVYTLAVSDTITATNSGQRLDGEITLPTSPASLPSGNGGALGSAAIQFTVGYPKTIATPNIGG